MNLYRRSSLICLLIAGIVTFSGCGPRGGLQYKKYGSVGLKKIGIVLGSPGKCDPGSNDAVTAGVKKAANELNLDYKLLVPKDLVNDQESLRFLADNNYDMVVAVGSGMTEALASAAPQYPDIKFIMFDGEVDEPNVTSVKIQEDDGAFLAGVEAASLTRTNLVGYIGEPITTQNSMENGFARGVQYVNSTEGKQVKVNVSYTGVTDKAAKVAELAKSLADNFYMSGVDVIFSANSSVNRGVANSALQNKKISICDDIQLMNSAPWNVYGAVEKKEDGVIYKLAQQMVAGKLTSGRQGFSLAQGAVDFIPSQAVPVDVSAKLNAVKLQLKAGQVKPYSIGIPEGLVTRVKPTPPEAAGTNTGNNGTTKPADSAQPSGNQPGGNQPGGNQPGSQSRQGGNSSKTGIVIRKVQKPPVSNQSGNTLKQGANTGQNAAQTGTGSGTITDGSKPNTGTGQQ